MTSFDELGLDDALVEALAAEGVERATAFQQDAIPVIRRGNNLVGHAGPGSGCSIAAGVALLDRLDPEGDPTRVLVLVPTSEAAQRQAEELARLASATGHRVAALGSPWVMPERAHVLFGCPDDMLSAVRSSLIKLEGVQALVADGVTAMLALDQEEALETVLESIPAEAQRVLLAAPMSDAVADLARRHVKRAVHLPPGGGPSPPPEALRGTVDYRVTGSGRLDSALELVNRLLQDDARHVLVFFASDDRAADGGDFLTVHGFSAGAPGDPAVPVWLGVDDLATREALKASEHPDQVRVLSVDVPGDADSLDRRHGGSAGIVMVQPAELAHLRQIATEAGYSLRPLPEPTPDAPRRSIESLRSTVRDAVTSRDLSGELLTLEPLFDDHAPAEVASALLALLREQPGREVAADVSPVEHVPAWSRLFISVGSRDGIGPRDLVGAIAGEAGISGSQVGKIDVKETFSLVEVDRSAAERVIRALNGTTLRGRSARVDFDRGTRGPRPGRGGRGDGGRRRR